MTKRAWGGGWSIGSGYGPSISACAEGNPELKLKLSVGASEAVRTELTRALSLSLPIHGLSLGAEQRSTVERTFSSFTTESMTIKQNFVAEPCKRLSVAVWQVIESFHISGPAARDLTKRPKREHLTHTVRSERYAYTFDHSYDEKCCPLPDEIYVVAFPTGTIEVSATAGHQGKKILSGVQGQYRLGDPVALSAFEALDDWLAVPEGPNLTFGVLTTRTALRRPQNPLAIIGEKASQQGWLDQIVETNTKTSLESMLHSRVAADVLSEVTSGVGGMLGLSPAGRLSVALPISASQPGSTYAKVRLAARAAPAKKTAARRAPAKKTAARRAPAKKTAARRAPAKKTAARRAPAKKTAARRAPAKKTAARRAPAKKTAARRAPAKKTAARRAPAKKTAARRAPARKAARRR